MKYFLIFYKIGAETTMLTYTACSVLCLSLFFLDIYAFDKIFDLFRHTQFKHKSYVYACYMIKNNVRINKITVDGTVW